MSLLLFGQKSRLKREIDKYEKRLSSSNIVDSEETKKCHLVKLYLEKDPEVRLRSIQTLSDLGSYEVICPIIKDLEKISRRWPKVKVKNINLLLLKAINQILKKA